MVQSSITAWLKKPPPAREKKAAEATPASSPVTRPHPHPHPHHVPDPDSEPQNPWSLTPLPPNVELVPLSEELMPAFKRLTTLTLPIAYPPTFFSESLVEPYHGVTLMALWHSAPQSAEKPRLIGAIRCRILPSATLYIATISLLAPYRSHGIATHLLQETVAKASAEHRVRCVTAHVWEANEDGLEWYRKRGFETLGKEEGYYRKLKPSGAFLVKKWVGVADLLASSDTAISAKAVTD